MSWINLLKAITCCFLSVLVTVCLFICLSRNLIRSNTAATSKSLLADTAVFLLDDQSIQSSKRDVKKDRQQSESLRPYKASLLTYQPIELLDIKPSVIKTISASLSSLFNDSPAIELHCLLMINEFGDVDRILFGDYHLTDLQRLEVERFFLNLRFKPGYMQGQAVPTVMRIKINI